MVSAWLGTPCRASAATTSSSSDPVSPTATGTGDGIGPGLESSNSAAISFGPEFFQLEEFFAIDQLLNDSRRGLSFSEQTTIAVQKQMSRIFSSQPGPRQLLRLLEILHSLSEDEDRSPLASIVYGEPIKLQKIDRLQRILNFLDQNWQESISLNDVAGIAALHPQSVSRFFQQHLGMSFQNYLIRLRLANAARALLEGDRTVSDIAFHSGFNNLTNFNRHFKAVYHQSPSKYRRGKPPHKGND